MWKGPKITYAEAMQQNRELIDQIVYKKYTRENSMTAVDPSLIWEKMIAGNKHPKLSDKRPAGSNIYYEYGFDEEKRFVYRKKVNPQNNHKGIIDICYVYEEKTIYEVPYDLYQMPYCEYRFDENNRILAIYGKGNDADLSRCEIYNWIYDDAAIVENPWSRFKENWLMFQNKGELIGLFELKKCNHDRQTKSVITGNEMNFMNYETGKEKVLEGLSEEIFYAQILDCKGLPTEYYQINLPDQSFIGTYFYIKPPKGFSYSKTKKIYKEEIIRFIEDEIKRTEFSIRTVGIQYFSNGLSVLNINVGFDDSYTDDVLTMRNSLELIFSTENMEILNYFDDYVNGKAYFNSHRKLMKEIAKEIKEKYSVEIVLDEIDD